MKLPGIGSHQSAIVQTDEWYTPWPVWAKLGTFDLDPCAPPGGILPGVPYLTAADDGLDHRWNGRVWLNPPYSEVERWIARLADHGTGTALVFARCETRWWFESVWPHATAILFVKGRITFDRPIEYGPVRAGANSGGPSTLIAYGAADAEALRRSGIEGAFVTAWTTDPLST